MRVLCSNCKKIFEVKNFIVFETRNKKIICSHCKTKYYIRFEMWSIEEKDENEQ